MKRKNLIAIKKVKKKKILIKNSKIKKNYTEFRKIIFKNIKSKSFALGVSGGADSLCLSYFSSFLSFLYKNRLWLICSKF